MYCRPCIAWLGLLYAYSGQAERFWSATSSLVLEVQVSVLPGVNAHKWLVLSYRVWQSYGSYCMGLLCTGLRVNLYYCHTLHGCERDPHSWLMQWVFEASYGLTNGKESVLTCVLKFATSFWSIAASVPCCRLGLFLLLFTKRRGRWFLPWVELPINFGPESAHH